MAEIEFEKCKRCGLGQDECECSDSLVIEDGTLLLAVGAIVWHTDINHVTIAYFNDDQEYVSMELPFKVSKIEFQKGIRFEHVHVEHDKFNILFEMGPETCGFPSGTVCFEKLEDGSYKLHVGYEHRTSWD